MLSKALKYLLDNAVLPVALAAAGTAVPLFGILLRIPILGSIIKQGIQKLLDDLYDKGVIGVKIELLDHASVKANAEYAPQVAIIREAQSQDELTPEQEAEYAKKLDKLIGHRPGIVNG